jgi:hypothetical protein
VFFCLAATCGDAMGGSVEIETLSKLYSNFRFHCLLNGERGTYAEPYPQQSRPQAMSDQDLDTNPCIAVQLKKLNCNIMTEVCSKRAK